MSVERSSDLKRIQEKCDVGQCEANAPLGVNVLLLHNASVINVVSLHTTSLGNMVI